MRKLLIVLCLIIAVSIPVAAFAAPRGSANQPVGSFCSIDTSTLTEQQKADLTAQFTKMIALKKESINVMIANGSITKAQGELMIKNLEAMESYRLQNGFTGGCGLGKGAGFGRGMMGRGNGFGFTTPTN